VKIDVHNHGVPESVLEFFAANPEFGIEITADHHMSGGAEGEYTLEPAFYDADAKVANLEEHGLDGAVVSIDPPFFYYEADPDAGAALVEVLNTGLRELAARRPDRLWWMATVPLQDPGRAAEVLAEQKRLGCVGVEIGTSTGASRLDEPHLEPFWAAAEELALPVMLHPAYQHPHPGYTRFALQNVVGNMLETTIAIERLIMAGVLDRHPGLTFVIVHSGGYVAYQHGRLRHARQVRSRAFDDESPRDARDYFGRVRFDCLTHDRKALAFLVDQVGAENMLLGTDLPCDMATPDPWDALLEATDERVAAQIAEQNPAALYGLETNVGAAA
jgi:aminocarboxymuconate-semialdehyde decarboxylase